jgi:putative glutathione S-transferase
VKAKDDKGGFVRQVSSFRSWVTPDGRPGPAGRGGFRAERGRYVLYAARICPWASRVLAARKLKKLEDVIEVIVVEPELTAQGWRMVPGADTANNAEYMHQVYTAADPRFTGRATVPALWDRATKTVVNNESADLLRMMNDAFVELASGPTQDLYPRALRAEIDALAEEMYPRLNNGVYRAGFATTQVAYEEAVADVFAMLDALEARLAGRTFLVGDVLTEVDIRAFVTLVRFDAAYHGLFKCNLRRVLDYPALSAYLRRLLAIPELGSTVDVDHIKRGYYSIRALNPSGIVPKGPLEPFGH